MEKPDLNVLREVVEWCPTHLRRNCSPVVNGCSRVITQFRVLYEVEAIVNAKNNAAPSDRFQPNGNGKYFDTELRAMRELGGQLVEEMNKPDDADEPDLDVVADIAERFAKMLHPDDAN